MTKEGIYFFTLSVGEDSGGRIMKFENRTDLEDTKEYYDSMAEESTLLFSWTMAKDNILVQINGELPE
ncbi:hypothetical protein [Virgibacillus sp. Bac330]|uniref:hypothetical protein n=1 Tax=Virgibacillus sp. Bac330 TaxID=2419841 RepID=UPI000EF480B6|nr:hypothetical protein [Virgibacillus sp. Bac330]